MKMFEGNNYNLHTDRICLSISKDESAILKGIAIFTVILAHANGWGHAFTNIPILKSGDAMGFLCQGGMTLFLFLSGYGLFLSYAGKKLDKYWENKISKVYLPAAIVQVLWLLIYGGYSGQLVGLVNGSGESFFAEILCINQSNVIDGTMWYLSYLAFCYSLFYCVGRFGRGRFPVLLFCILWSATIPVSIRLWPYGKQYVCAFALGVLFARFTYTLPKDISKWCIVIIAGVCLILCAVYFVFFLEKNSILDNVGGTILAALLLLFVKLIGEARLGIIKRFGKISFYVYLLEAKVIFGWFSYESHSDVVRLGAMVVFMAITILLAEGMRKIVDGQWRLSFEKRS